MVKLCEIRMKILHDFPRRLKLFTQLVISSGPARKKSVAFRQKMRGILIAAARYEH
jgi:hypothetical protein